MTMISRRSLLRFAAQTPLAFTALGQAACAPVRSGARAAQLTVLVSGAFEQAFRKLAPEYERRSGMRIVTVQGPSMGETPGAIPNRIDRREPADVVILARESLDRLAVAGKLVPGSGCDLVLSKIAVAVKEGAPIPDISTPSALRAALLAARSIAYSDSASGVYVSTVLFPRLGISGAMAGKARMIPGTPVGLIVARGEADIGFQQLSELKPVAGINIVGLLPDELQKVTRFSAGIVAYSAYPGEGQKLIDFLRSDAAHRTMIECGLIPAPPVAAAHPIR